MSRLDIDAFIAVRDYFDALYIGNRSIRIVIDAGYGEPADIVVPPLPVLHRIMDREDRKPKRDA
jgi:hypothetical protein